MINDEPSIKDMAALWHLCMNFIRDQYITDAETVYQSSRVAEASYGFIADICDIVGYEEDE